MKTNICIITSNSSLGREYAVHTTSAMECAKKYGRGEAGEVVTVYRMGGKALTQARWINGKYVNCWIIE